MATLSAVALVGPLLSTSVREVMPVAAAKLTRGQVPSTNHVYVEKPAGATIESVVGAVTVAVGEAETTGGAIGGLET